MRQGIDLYQINAKGADTLILGYDYVHQAWVKDGKYVRCGHPDTMDCQCYGKLHEGEPTKPGDLTH